MTFILDRFLSLFNGGMRAYKVQDVKREQRVGVTAKNFQELLEKGAQKLKLHSDEVTVVIEDDGTVVADDKFFKKLPAQTVFVFLKKGEKWRGAGALIHDALSKLYCATRKNEIASQIRDLLKAEDAPEKIHIISQYLELLETNSSSEKRQDHEDWFEGLNKKYKTKSDVMRHSAQTRIRSYYVTAKDQIEREADVENKQDLLDLLDEGFQKLKKSDFNSLYFDRTSNEKGRMCDPQGWFRCEGPYDVDHCDKFHTINPYASKGYRQLFGLWNLDHIIEKSREVIPTLIEAARKKQKYQNLNVDLLYKLLFSRENLKLVQIGCHKKAARESGKVKWSDFCSK
ncbi:DNA fragmentation factor subunit beta-like [Ostrea edulis]|uniref:DNA fragmentation factor subunit beta-like n=1 Tax=Ostrea edulis TaxID=37623 RepID=UPI0024AED80B|nr:DNA fragmentation factor subunit beta-like [Ostrea edulis]